MESSTQVLRRMLDERGVEWSNIRNDGSESDYLTEWQFDGIEGHAIATEWAVGQHLTVCIAHPMTPEQAVAATLGESPRLPHFWTHDGTLHIELPKLPESISVRLPDQRDREVGSARAWLYTLGAGTCHNTQSDFDFMCSECGKCVDNGRVLGFNFCPRCGRRIVEVDDVEVDE